MKIRRKITQSDSIVAIWSFELRQQGAVRVFFSCIYFCVRSLQGGTQGGREDDKGRRCEPAGLDFFREPIEIGLNLAPIANIHLTRQSIAEQKWRVGLERERPIITGQRIIETFQIPKRVAAI